jgi:hypothetical protein
MAMHKLRPVPLYLQQVRDTSPCIETMSKFMLYLGLGMSIFFMVAAVFIVVNPPEHPQIRANKEIVAICLFLYGVFRLYRSIRSMKGKRNLLD